MLQFPSPDDYKMHANGTNSRHYADPDCNANTNTAANVGANFNFLSTSVTTCNEASQSELATFDVQALKALRWERGRDLTAYVQDLALRQGKRALVQTSGGSFKRFVCSSSTPCPWLVNAVCTRPRKRQRDTTQDFSDGDVAQGKYWYMMQDYGELWLLWIHKGITQAALNQRVFPPQLQLPENRLSSIAALFDRPYRQWKLADDKIEELTAIKGGDSTTSDQNATNAAVNRLIDDMRFFARGKRGVLCVFIDFEKCSPTKKPKNVTQICQHVYMSRHRRQWETFVRDALGAGHHGHLYSGVCVIDNHDRVVHAQGCFPEGSSSTFDVSQFSQAFDQLSRRAILAARNAQSNTKATVPATVKGSYVEDIAAFHLGDETFHIVQSTFVSILAISKGQERGLIVERLPIGIVIIAFQHPRQMEEVFPIVDKYCAMQR
ncbi:hypothetical protein ATCC90586_005352 [Pythium insidiosum]|nr:hypothetical protein ATCC90586_005352 [Pythium insidiosum]